MAADRGRVQAAAKGRDARVYGVAVGDEAARSGSVRQLAGPGAGLATPALTVGADVATSIQFVIADVLGRLRSAATSAPAAALIVLALGGRRTGRIIARLAAFGTGLVGRLARPLFLLLFFLRQFALPLLERIVGLGHVSSVSR
jgi:hypothetical protein